jgi:DNA-binding Xre family transcriptional regulator
MVTYKKLWHLLIDKNMKKNDLMKAASLSPTTISKLNRGDNVGISILVRICKALNCKIDDILDILPDQIRK